MVLYKSWSSLPGLQSPLIIWSWLLLSIPAAGWLVWRSEAEPGKLGEAVYWLSQWPFLCRCSGDGGVAILQDFGSAPVGVVKGTALQAFKALAYSMVIILVSAGGAHGTPTFISGLLSSVGMIIIITRHYRRNYWGLFCIISRQFNIEPTYWIWIN